MKESLGPETVISHNQIVAKLGAAGMGEVYLAQDTTELAGEEFKLLHVNDLADMTKASPALVEERLLIRTEHHL